MGEKEIKNFDDDLIKHLIKPMLKDLNYSETIEKIYDGIMNFNQHPMNQQILSIYKTFENTFPKQPKHFNNDQIKNTITEVATLASAEMLFALCKYYKDLKKCQSELFQPLSQIVVKHIYPSAFEFVCRRTKDNDFRFELQMKKYVGSDLREVLAINTKIYPSQYPSDAKIFNRTITVLNKLELSSSIDDLRIELVNSQTAIIEDVKDMHNNVLPKDFDSDDLLALLTFSLLHSTMKHPFAVSLILECFLTDEDFLTQAGYSLTTFTVAIQSVIKMTENECVKNKEVLQLNPVVILARQSTIKRKPTIMCTQPVMKPTIVTSFHENLMVKKPTTKRTERFIIGSRSTVRKRDEQIAGSVDCLDSPIHKKGIAVSFDDNSIFEPNEIRNNESPKTNAIPGLSVTPQGLKTEMDISLDGSLPFSMSPLNKPESPKLMKEDKLKEEIIKDESIKEEIIQKEQLEEEHFICFEDNEIKPKEEIIPNENVETNVQEEVISQNGVDNINIDELILSNNECFYDNTPNSKPTQEVIAKEEVVEEKIEQEEAKEIIKEENIQTKQLKTNEIEQPKQTKQNILKENSSKDQHRISVSKVKKRFEKVAQLASTERPRKPSSPTPKMELSVKERKKLFESKFKEEAEPQYLKKTNESQIHKPLSPRNNVIQN